MKSKLDSIRVNLNEYEKEKFREVLKHDRISNVIFTIVWNSFIGFGLASMYKSLYSEAEVIPSLDRILARELVFEDQMFLILLGFTIIFGLGGLYLVLDTISRFKHECNYYFIYGTILDKSRHHINDSWSYEADIKIDTGDILRDITINSKIYDNPGTSVILAIKKTRSRKKIQVKYVFFR